MATLQAPHAFATAGAVFGPAHGLLRYHYICGRLLVVDGYAAAGPTAQCS
jgi:hypothetical protein